MALEPALYQEKLAEVTVQLEQSRQERPAGGAGLGDAAGLAAMAAAMMNASSIGSIPVAQMVRTSICAASHLDWLCTGALGCCLCHA